MEGNGMIEELRRGYVGNPRQLAGMRRVALAEGRAKCCTVIEVSTAAGLQVDILPDTGLDIGQVRFKGRNMSWMSKNGYDSPAAFSSHETEFLNTFPGGLLYSCGLRSAGPANRDGDEWHPLHGRFHALQAENVSLDERDGCFVVAGTLRETALFGHNLELRRTITIPMYGAEIKVSDELTNCAPRDEEYMTIYHCNFGYPLLSEKARLILPEGRETTPRTEFARTGLGRECEFDAPVPGEEERVFFHKLPESRVTLENPAVGTALRMTWSGDTLPILAEWRSMAAGDYVLGLEPTNNYIMGRHDERANGTLPVLKPFETVRHQVSFAFDDLSDK